MINGTDVVHREAWGMFAAICSSLASRRCRHSALEKGAQCSGTQLSATGFWLKNMGDTPK